MITTRELFEGIKLALEKEGAIEAEAAMEAARELRPGISDADWNWAFIGYPRIKHLPEIKKVRRIRDGKVKIEESRWDRNCWVESLTWKHFVRNMSFPLS